MNCEIRDALRKKHISATLAWGKYAESLEGVMRTRDEILADEEKLEHLQVEDTKTQQEFLDHINEHGCQSGDD